MSMTTLSTEIIQKIYESCELIDALHLSQTSKKNYSALRGRYLHLIGQAMNNSYGPIAPLVKLVLSTEPEKKTRRPVGTEIRRNALLDRIIQTPSNPVLSIDLMKKMLRYGRIAAQWIEVFPQFRWRLDYKNRRFLRPHEQERLRRAIYHYWTYGNLFHDETYCQFNPGYPDIFQRDDPRIRLLRTYSTIELIQLSEYLSHIIQVIQIDLYPSDVSIHAIHSFPSKAMSKIAWGTGTMYRLLIEDLMKYDPEDILHLFNNTSVKAERAGYMFKKGTYFNDSPASLKKALRSVSEERGGIVAEGFKGVDHPVFPSSSTTSLGDEEASEDVRFGIVDLKGDEGFERHAWANDAVVSGVYCGKEEVSEDAD